MLYSVNIFLESFFTFELNTADIFCLQTGM